MLLPCVPDDASVIIKVTQVVAVQDTGIPSRRFEMDIQGKADGFCHRHA